MIDFRPALFVIGILLTTLSVAMLAPFAVDIVDEEIASVTGVSKSTAVSRYRYALEKLRTDLSDELGLNEGFHQFKTEAIL